MYETSQEANQKLQESAVLFDGRLVYIVKALDDDGKILLNYCELPFSATTLHDSQYVDIKDPRWDFRSMSSKIGYVNVEKNPYDGAYEALFCSRVPVRASRQGLDQKTVHVEQAVGRDLPYTFTQVRDFGMIQHTIQNKFPTLKEAVSLVTKDPLKFRSVAIARKMAVIFDRVNPPNILYRGTRVGYSETGDRIKLADHKQFLKEELADVMGFEIA